MTYSITLDLILILLNKFSTLLMINMALQRDHRRELKSRSLIVTQTPNNGSILVD